MRRPYAHVGEHVGRTIDDVGGATYMLGSACVVGGIPQPTSRISLLYPQLCPQRRPAILWLKWR